VFECEVMIFHSREVKAGQVGFEKEMRGAESVYLM
jgi:hypothetical protein